MRQLRRDKQLLSLGIHTEVDQRVEGGVGHGQPEEGEEDVLSVAVPHHGLQYCRHMQGREGPFDSPLIRQGLVHLKLNHIDPSLSCEFEV